MNSPAKTAVQNRLIANVVKALNALDGRQETATVTVAGKEQTIPITVPYKISGPARLLCANWMIAGKAQADALGVAHDGLVRQHAPPGGTEVPDDKMAEFDKEWNKTLVAEHEFDLPKLNVADLNVDANQLPISVLYALSPILIQPS